MKIYIAVAKFILLIYFHCRTSLSQLSGGHDKNFRQLLLLSVIFSVKIISEV